MTWHDTTDAGGLAVITGGASGLGFATAQHLSQQGFDILLADIEGTQLEAAAKTLQATGATVHTQITDVADADAVAQLADRAFDIGPVAVLMNNAGIAIPSVTWGNPQAWRRTFDVNFFGVLNGVQSFVPRLIEAGKPATIINTGSKQGITTPPGNPAYNASKAAMKVLSEQLAHELREANASIDVHLFVPGFTYTAMVAEFFPDKPDGAWSSEETVGYLFERIAQGDFYVLCPDNMVTEAIDARRVLWNAKDIAENRPPLSRWHNEWKNEYENYEKSEG